MTLALIARADDGGLGTQAWELARHLQPDKVLVVDVQPRRGDFHLDRYRALGYTFEDHTLAVASNPIPRNMVDWLAAGVDGVVAPETFYLDDKIMRVGVDTRLLLLVNPELFVPQYRALADQGAIEVFAPTTWETDRLGKHTLLPQPVARDRITWRQRTGCAKTFLHISSPAMLDRNGTQLVREACEAYDGEPVDVLIAGPAKPAEPTNYPAVRVYPLPDRENYWEHWQGDIDVFLQPRRYGGLSMVQAEAAAAGIPTICLDRDPERAWGGAIVVPTAGSTMHRMKGGDFPVYDAHAVEVADAMSWCSTLVDLAESSDAADRWADSISWARLRPTWQEALSRPAAPGGPVPA